jgi:hypothetical protein
MEKIPPSTFWGFVDEIKIHTLVCFDASYINKTVERVFNTGTVDVTGIAADEGYALADWCTVEMVRRAFPELRVHGHHINDVFGQFYDTHFHLSEFKLRHGTQSLFDFKRPPKVLKVLPMGERSMLALGF